MVFGSLRPLGAIGLAFDLQNDCIFNKAIEECHCQGTVREVVSPLVKVHVRDQGGGTLLITRSDDLIEQVRRLRTFGAFDLVEPKFVDKCSAEHLSTNVKLSEM